MNIKSEHDLHINQELNLNAEDLIELQESVHQNNAIEFQRIFQECLFLGQEQKAGTLAEKILNHEVVHVQQNNRKAYEFILKNLRKIFPSINSYFHILDIPTTTRDASVLNPQGIQVVVDDYKEKGSWQDMTCLVCEDFEEFDKLVFKQIQDMSLKKDKQRCSFLIRHKSKTPPFANSHHMTTFYLEKRVDETYQVFISDSVGKGNHFAKAIQSRFKKFFDQHFPDEKLKGYVYFGLPRQMDNTSCPIFALRDALQFAKHSDEIMQWVEKNTTEKKKRKQFVEIQDLPHMMIKTTQSLSFIKDYNLKHREQQVKIRPKHLLSEQGKKYNGKIAYHYLKYERFIITQTIKKPSKILNFTKLLTL